MNRILSLAAMATLVLTTPAQASDANDATMALETAAATLAPNRFVWSDASLVDPVMSPVTVVVSIPLQRAFVYRGDTLVAASSVSTGKDENPTPVGIYPILQKNEKHRSNLYNDAPMPFMQRLTWDGIALHAGRNPGFPDSHGCIRLPTEFAKKLFAITDVGTTVVITDDFVEGSTLDRNMLVTEVMRANAEQLAVLP
ncbi:L,D-transpeptidase family protein [Sphingomonas sp. CFBP 8760]|uniref:L,D-transpeptidase family protein n=1 Tax=Sphingomonas sp. CFBP 8760 TaxID=2775282 RepID=UPI00178061DE|nr:L,D-transpeptidase family protein [Sphingomonas sp. CFBP 8760]MBD8545294.1 L,D-transpeptidase family protein [Sphingomonas sp. CFBP 8760]